LQAQIDWIRGLPHRHKVVIAGNHDLLLDEEFVRAHPVREMGPWDKTSGKAKENLEWGDVIYLEDEAVTLTVNLGGDKGASRESMRGGLECSCRDKGWDQEKKATDSTSVSEGGNSSGRRARQVKIYGAPRTPGSGQRAFGFQYDQEKEDVWAGKIPPDTDILLTHGPPKFHLDQCLGCDQLLREIWRARPGVVVFGHIHSGHGQNLMVYDSVQYLYEKILGGEENLRTLSMLASHTIFTQLGRILPSKSKANEGSEPERKRTRFVNAAFRSGRTTYEATEFEI
jgi:hypothetical protein